MVVVGAGKVPRSHREVAAFIPAYASGVLSGPVEVAVRRHLAAGCEGCRQALYEHPVGLPRTASASDQARPGGWGIAAPTALIVSLAATAIGASVLLGNAGESAPVGYGALPGSAAAMPAAERSTQQTASVTTPVPPPPDASAVLPGARSPQARPATPGVAERLAASLLRPGTTLHRLRPTATGAAARGWTAWDPALGRLFVYGTGLPLLRRPWEAMVSIAGRVRALPLRRADDGGMWAVFDLSRVSLGCPERVQIAAPGDRRVVLEGGVEHCGSRPAA